VITPQTRRSPAGTGLRDRTHNTSAGNSITASPLHQLLDRLEGVITTGKGWRARCPAHGGKSASLAITEGDNGTLLVHCFTGCQTHDVLAAVGLQVGDLFVRRDLRTMTPAERSQLRQAALLPRWKVALNVLTTEAQILLIAANQLGDGLPLNDADLSRLRVSALRIMDAQDVLNHGR
jgi:hypothetical protein